MACCGITAFSKTRKYPKGKAGVFPRLSLFGYFLALNKIFFEEVPLWARHFLKKYSKLINP
jgi:hypothetical protein